MITVYHAPSDLLRDLWMGGKPETIREHFARYRAVAKVETRDLDAAYLLTNTIEAPWWEHPRVEFLGSAEHGMDGCRSTSVGDVMERGDRKFIVSGVGFVDFETGEALTADQLNQKIIVHGLNT